MEVLAVLLSLYLVTVNTDLTTIDLLAFSGYKYVGYVQHLSMFVFTFPSPAHPLAASSFITGMCLFCLDVCSDFPLSSDEIHFLIFILLVLCLTSDCVFVSLVFRMIIGVVAGLLFGRLAYYLSLLWCCVAIFVFMVSSSIR